MTGELRRRAVISGYLFAAALAAALATGVMGGASGAGGASVGALPLGTFSPIAGSADSCPAGQVCKRFSVACPGVAKVLTGTYAVGEPTAPARGVVVFFGGGGGQVWWSDINRSQLSLPFLDARRADGYKIVQVRWQSSWSTSSPGESAGPATLACRPATVLSWMHDNLYVPLGLGRQNGPCGFCATGNSGGSTQVSYAISHFGLEDLLTAVIPTSGPTHAAIVKGCLRDTADKRYWFPKSTGKSIDNSYGVASTAVGPCEAHDSSYVSRWTQDAVDTGGSDYLHPNTRVHVIIGGGDGGITPAHAEDYVQRLRTENSPMVTHEIVSGMGHGLPESPSGLEALRKAIVNEL